MAYFVNDHPLATPLLPNAGYSEATALESLEVEFDIDLGEQSESSERFRSFQYKDRVAYYAPKTACWLTYRRAETTRMHRNDWKTVNQPNCQSTRSSKGWG